LARCEGSGASEEVLAGERGPVEGAPAEDGCAHGAPSVAVALPDWTGPLRWWCAGKPGRLHSIEEARPEQEPGFLGRDRDVRRGGSRAGVGELAVAGRLPGRLGWWRPPLGQRRAHGPVLPGGRNGDQAGAGGG